MDDCQQKLLDLLDGSGPYLHALLTRLSLSEHTAEDLMQELFIKLARSKHFHKADHPAAYAARAAINLAFDHRRRQKMNPLPLPDQFSLPDHQSSPLHNLIQAEQLQQILDATAHLSPMLRDAFILRHVQQESYETIADQLQRSPHQARALCSRAIAQLRQILNNQHHTNPSPEKSNARH